MPSNDIASDVAKLIVDCPFVWGSPTFASRTGFSLVPFSDECSADDITFTGAHYEHARQFLKAWGTLDNHNTRLSFMRQKSDQYAQGRIAFQEWARKSWDAWGLKTVIHQTMKAQGFEGFEFMRQMKSQTVSTCVRQYPHY